MRTAELATSGAMCALAAFFMWYAAKLPIGWDPESGPGGGMFPFWLSAGMFVCGAISFFQRLATVDAPEAIRHVFIHRQASGQLAATVLALILMVALMPLLGAYIVVPVFLAAYTRLLGRSTWATSLGLGVGSIFVMFFFFEVTLKTLLPKGVTEPLFIPLYAFFF